MFMNCVGAKEWMYICCTALYWSKQFSHNILHVPLDSNVLKTKLTPSGGSLPVQAVKAPHKTHLENTA